MAFTAICSNYEAFGLVVLRHLRVFVAFMGHWGWTFVVFYSVCCIYGALALYVWHLGLV